MDEKAREAPVDAAARPPAETLAEGPRRRGGAPKRKAAASASSSSSSASKRLAKERSSIPLHLLPQVHNGPCTRARQSPNKLAGAAALQKPPQPAPGTADDGGGKEISADRDTIEAGDAELTEEPVVDHEFEATKARGAGAHVVPTPAGWFSWRKIHPVEKHTLASFFNGKSENRTPDIYFEIRNSIMKKFHADPQTQLELKALEELSAGDMEARQEVMEFLDHWGLINFHPFPPSNPNPSVADASIPDADGRANTSSLVEKLFQFEMVQSCPRSAPKKQNLAAPAVLPNFLPEPVIADELVKSEGPSVEYHCNSCSADCSGKRYHCQKQADFDLCTECYNKGKFGSGMVPTDFILMEPAEVLGVSSGSWTDQETLLLLEALELFGKNWNEIAEHVATKTKAQCILHFLQMPIEDPFLEGAIDVDDNIVENMDPSSANNESAALLVPETKEIGSDEDTKNLGNKDQPASSSMDSFKGKSDEAEALCETDNNIAIDVLKSAFQVVGCLPEQGELLSFAEAGNPVMAVAAFLVGLVGPDIARNSARSSLKALSEDSPSIQLATRHCFLLEDPPNDRKDPPASECAVANMDGGEVHKEEGQTPTLEVATESKDCEAKNEENTVSIEEENTVSIEKENKSSVPLQEYSQKQPPSNGSKDLEATTGIAKDSGDPVLADEQISPATEKNVGDPALSEVLLPNNTEESADSVLREEATAIKAKEVDGKQSTKEDKTDAMEAGDVNVAQQCCDTSKAVDAIPTLALLDEREPQQTAASASTVENKEKAADCDKNASPSNGEKECDMMETDDDHNIDRIRRAAVTGLAAAAVKAKLLAKEEEDQILQFVSLIIEKQLYKLETKLAFLTEMESVIMQVREQTDKARQRLFHERTQIIAARLGLPASSARANPPSLPINKIAMNFSTAGARPLYMASQRPPTLRRT